MIKLFKKIELYKLFVINFDIDNIIFYKEIIKYV